MRDSFPAPGPSQVPAGGFGVKRISTGALASAAWAGFVRAAKGIAEHRRFDALTGHAPARRLKGRWRIGAELYGQ